LCGGFFFFLQGGGRPLAPRFLCTYDNDLYPTDLKYIPPANRQKKDGNLKAAVQIQRLYIL